MTGSFRFRSEEPVRDHEHETSRGCFRSGDAVLCRIRRCESDKKEGGFPMPPRIEELNGILDRPSTFQPMWWVRVGDSLRYVWTDEIERKK